MTLTHHSTFIKGIEGSAEGEIEDVRQTTVFDPPFYGHPMLVPPSPSLTTMFRTRSTTPDEEGTAIAEIDQQDWDIMVKVPTYEYYGFVMYLVSMLGFGVYIVWALTPAPVLKFFEIHYYLSRWWALAIPTWLFVLVIYIHVVLNAYNTEVLTKPFSSLECIVDQYALVGEEDGAAHGRVVDLRLCDVNKQQLEET
ncbi:Pig-P subunit [Schizosaccharomyces pombe]|uniref:Meiotically up-regulated gene 84 protein n=1 Tax=Schizosaccharomyces pombe (strain 972 / ATCC 24843) TaxID=284812 RepID=MUG84_SCHPO|nr:putative pig-P phosphatidylinositol N-acetylglucosaminyltransferase subunit [Schizosaccharomyces pombe]O13904.3 RecName: Full=Meiotically up-regulated gene 84 protein [Schizosaccharomyces pombe 972h-]CAB16583.3 pig-P subunit (predicted) [Schizosaccharomyces pombe]|eukprot:NP_593243.2 putative pig-P phosphatidylinositol N-acetylglucosaminyltransferase subunit [Schizosaccharomyces pombe]